MTSARGSQALNHPTVLVVEDDADTRAMISDALESAGAVVMTAASTAEALDALGQVAPDCIVTDLDLGSDTGFRLLGAVRAFRSQAVAAAPVIAITGRDEYRRPERETPFDGFLFKPFDPADLVLSVSSVLDAHRPRRPRSN